MAGAPNYDYDTQQSEIARRQKIADAMMSGSLAPIAQNMPKTTAGGLMAFAAPLIQALLAKRMNERTSQERADLTQRYQSDLTTGMQNFYNTANGDTENNVKGNLRKAIADAMASNHPVLRDFAMKQLAEQQKGVVTPKDLLPLSDPASVLGNPNDPTGWQPKKEIGTVGDVVFDKNKGEIVRLKGPTPTREFINGDLYQGSPSTGELKKLDNAPKISVSANPVIKGQSAGMQEYFKNAASQVGELGKIATQAQENKQSIAELRNLNSQGIFSNVSTGPATFLSNLGQSVGVNVDTSKLGNTETYNAITTQLWQGLVSKYGGNRGVTQEEAKEIKKMLPLAANSPQAREQLFAILDHAADRQIQQYQSANNAFARAAKSDDPTIFSNEFQGIYTPQPSQPQPVTQPGVKKPTVSNW